jgi:hypothetical protein
MASSLRNVCKRPAFPEIDFDVGRMVQRRVQVPARNPVDGTVTGTRQFARDCDIEVRITIRALPADEVA